MYKLSFFVPVANAEAVKTALFEIGAGRIGDYDSCAWETLGMGQFRPLQGSQPYLGQQGKIEKVEELKIEMVCEDALVKEAVGVLKQAHPYEEPAYDVWRLADF